MMRYVLSVLLVVVAVLAATVGSPNYPRDSIAGVTKADPGGAILAFTQELDGTSSSSGNAQEFGVGDPGQVFVLNPLRQAAPLLGSNTLQQAIATYERTVVSQRAPFDDWIDGNEKAVSEEAKRGFALFNAKAQCSSCHEGWNFTNDGFQDVGLPSDDVGRGKFMPNVIKMQHAFKTPGLREISRRNPYMHDGSLATLEQVVEHYDKGGVDRPSRSDLMKPLGLTPQEKSDLVTFLKTLTSDLNPTAMPVLPR